MDIIGQFMTEQFDKDEASFVSKTEFADKLNAWLTKNNYQKYNAKQIANYMKGKFEEKQKKVAKNKNVRCYLGLKVKEDADSEDDE
jgi:hypothetical protein